MLSSKKGKSDILNWKVDETKIDRIGLVRLAQQQTD